MKFLAPAAAVAALLAGCTVENQQDTAPTAQATADRDAAPALLVPNGTIPTESGAMRIERLATLRSHGAWPSSRTDAC